jgi:hypothetical protein
MLALVGRERHVLIFQCVRPAAPSLAPLDRPGCQLGRPWWPRGRWNPGIRESPIPPRKCLQNLQGLLVSYRFSNLTFLDPARSVITPRSLGCPPIRSALGVRGRPGWVAGSRPVLMQRRNRIRIIRVASSGAVPKEGIESMGRRLLLILGMNAAGAAHSRADQRFPSRGACDSVSTARGRDRAS